MVAVTHYLKLIKIYQHLTMHLERLNSLEICFTEETQENWIAYNEVIEMTAKKNACRFHYNY